MSESCRSRRRRTNGPEESSSGPPSCLGDQDTVTVTVLYLTPGPVESTPPAAMTRLPAVTPVTFTVATNLPVESVTAVPSGTPFG